MTHSSAHTNAILTHRIIHRGRKFDFEMVRVERAGKKAMDREVVRHPGAVVVMPVLEDGRIVLIRNVRWAVSRKNQGPVELWECCAGTLDRDASNHTEDPSHCAARELIEETGYQAGKLVPLMPPSIQDPSPASSPDASPTSSTEQAGYFYTTPGMTDEKMYPFLATNLTHVGQKLEEDEAIRVEAVTTSRLWQLVDSGELRDAKSLVAIMLAARRGLIPS